MGILDTPLRAVASTVIGIFSSVDATLTRTVRGGYDPTTGIETTYPVTADLKMSPPQPYSTRELGDNVLRSDLKAYVAAADTGDVGKPNPETDTLTRDGATYRIVSVNEISSGDQAAMYELQLRI